MRGHGGFRGRYADIETCRWCGDPVVVMAMIGTGFCCGQHQRAAEVLATEGDSDSDEGTSLGDKGIGE